MNKQIRKRDAKGRFVRSDSAITPAVKSKRADGFYNAITSVGTARDKGTRNSFAASARLRSEMLDAIYAESAIFARIIDLVVDDALRKWIDFNHEKADLINDRLEDLRVKRQYRRAGKRERLHGGCAIFADIDDGQTPDQPLNRERIKRIHSLQIFEADYIYPLNSQRGLESELFQLTSNTESMVIHRSRLSIWPGIEVSDDYTLNNNGWGESLGRRVLPAVERLEMFNHVVSNLGQDFITDHWGMFDLNDLIDSDSDESLKARLDAALIGISKTNAVVTDSQDTYSKIVTNVTGVDTLRNSLERDLTQVSSYPHTKILGESPGASLGATGGSQKEDYKEQVSAYQEDKVREHIQWILDLICDEQKLDYVDFDFRPLDEPSMTVLADVYLKMAQADQIYYNMGLPETVIFESRFKDGFSMKTTYDDDTEAEVRAIEESIANGFKQAQTAENREPMA